MQEITDEGVADMSTVDSKSDLSENNVLSDNGGNSNSSPNWGNFLKITPFLLSVVHILKYISIYVV